MAPSLLDLPPEILLLIPNHLADIEDFKNIASTCSKLHVLYASTTSPQVILRLCANASRIFFRPSPDFLVAACAKELGAWAKKSDEHAAAFRTSCRDGMSGLLELCLGEARCGLTIARVRELYELRMSTINPVTDLIDKCIGKQWYATPNFWNGGASDAYTLDSDPAETFFHLCIYGELFGDAMVEYVMTGTVPRYAHPANRMAFVKYCVAGLQHDANENGLGPIRPAWTDSMLSLEWLLRSHNFNRVWSEVSKQLASAFELGRVFWDGDEFEAEMRYVYVPDSANTMHSNEGLSRRMAVWRACFVHSGFAGLTQLARSGLGEFGKPVGDLNFSFAGRMTELWRSLSTSDTSGHLKHVTFTDGWSTHRTANWPDLKSDLGSVYVFRMDDANQ